jgi:hypothetical protein
LIISGSSAEVGSSNSQAQRPRDRHTLLLAARQLQRKLLRLLGDAHALQLSHRALFRLGLRHAGHPHRSQRQVLQHRQVRKEVELLEHHADLAADLLDRLDVVGELDAVDLEHALLVLLEAVDAADQRRLAGARRPADDDALALPDMQVDVAQHVEVVPVPLVDLVEGDDGMRVVLVGAHVPALRQRVLLRLSCFSTHRL